MSKLIVIIAVATMAALAQPSISNASRGKSERAYVQVRTAPVTSVLLQTGPDSSKHAGSTVMAWIRHASIFFFWKSPLS